MTRGRSVGWLLALGAVGLDARAAAAHVKWFSHYSFTDPPRPLGAVITPTFWALMALSVVTVAALVPLDRRLERLAGYQRINEWLESRAYQAPTLLRIGVGAGLLLAWQADALLAPEMRAAPWVGWAQFVVALLLVLDATVAAAGLGILLLFAYLVAQAGIFHALDYAFYAGAGYYLLVCGSSDERVRGSGLPALYLAVGFSLCWVALEKMVYPQWGSYVLSQHPRLAMGLDVRFFLLAAAFVEFSLGYLLIINLLQRPLALVITLVFFATTLVFGKTEVIGHTPIHAALIVFLLEGPGTTFAPPISLHQRTALRMAFAGVNLVILLGALLMPYTLVAERVFIQTMYGR